MGFADRVKFGLFVISCALTPFVSSHASAQNSPNPTTLAVPSAKAIFAQGMQALAGGSGGGAGARVTPINGTNEEEEEALPPRVRPTGPVEFVSSDPRSHIRPPEEDPRVRINPEAPGPFKAMAIANQEGDHEMAEKYADQYVRYMINVMYEVRELTQLIGEAMVRNGVIKEADWVGVSQFMNRELAQAREESSAPVRPNHQTSLERIKPDPRGEAEIYVICTISSQYCREMAPDVERLWQVVKRDEKLKMAVLNVGQAPAGWIRSYVEYTGLTMPILDGADAAKAFRVGFVPTIVVVSPATGAAYLRTGELSFKRMYEFVRRVQGREPVETRFVQEITKTPIGQVELAKKTGRSLIWEESYGPAVVTASRGAAAAQVQLGKF